MTILFIIMGILSFGAIGYRFATRVLSKEPLADRAK